MGSIQNFFHTVAEHPPLSNGTAVDALRAWVSSVDTNSLKDYLVVFVLAGLILSLLIVAIVHRAKVHKRRENRWRKASFQERKCSSCRSLSCDHANYTALVR